MKVIAWHDRQPGRFHDVTGTVLIECSYEEAAKVLGLKETGDEMVVGLERSTPRAFDDGFRYHAEAIVKSLGCYLAGLPYRATHDTVTTSPGERLLRLVRDFAEAERARAPESTP